MNPRIENIKVELVQLLNNRKTLYQQIQETEQQIQELEGELAELSVTEVRNVQ